MTTCHITPQPTAALQRPQNPMVFCNQDERLGQSTAGGDKIISITYIMLQCQDLNTPNLYLQVPTHTLQL